MPFNLKSRRRKVYTHSSSDSDSDLTFYHKEQLQHVKKIKRNLQNLCDNDSSMIGESDTDSALITQRENISHMDIANEDNNKHKTMGSQLQIESSSSEPDTIPTKDVRRSTRKRTKVQANYLYNFDADDSSDDSSASLMKSKRKFSISSSTKKQAKKTGAVEAVSCSEIIESESNGKNSVIQNREKVSKLSSVEKHRNKNSTVEVTEDKSNEKNYDDIDIIPTTPVANSKEVKEKKQDDRLDYKPYITKVLEESKNRFALFRSQITYLQKKYCKDEIVTLQDANNIIFMLTCIISKLKEELTEHQHNLMDAVIKCRMQNSPSCIISSMHYERFLNNNHLQVQRKTHKPFGSDKLISTPVSRKRPLQVTKISRNILQPSDQNLVPYINRKQNNIDLASKKNNFLASVQTDEDNVTTQNDKSYLSIYDEETVIDNNENSLGENVRNTKSISRSLENRQNDRPIIRHDFFRNILDTEKLMQLDSDVDSTCSTLNLFFSEDVDEPENNHVDIIDARDRTESHVPEVTLIALNNNNIQKRSLSRINSVETTILPNRPAINTKKQFSNVEKGMFSTSLSNENLIQEPVSEFLVPNANDLSKNYPSKYTDKKLQMNCRVLVEKYRL